MNLIVFSGLPGTGKSTLAETTGRRLGIPVFAKDRLEAALQRSIESGVMNTGWAGYELLTALAESQLRLGQSAILDSVATTAAIRQSWRELAAQYGAGLRVIECICSDESIHRARMRGRKRNIPGWPELDWSDVERVRERYEAWSLPRLVVDAVNPLEANVKATLEYLNQQRTSQ